MTPGGVLGGEALGRGDGNRGGAVGDMPMLLRARNISVCGVARLGHHSFIMLMTRHGMEAGPRYSREINVPSLQDTTFYALKAWMRTAKIDPARLTIQALPATARERSPPTFGSGKVMPIASSAVRLTRVGNDEMTTIRGAIDLEGRIILVSGGARGLGAAFAEACGRAGARVLIADIRADLSSEMAERLRAEGLDVTSYQVDLADPTSIDALAAAVEEDVGRLDGLLNNAALATGIGGKGYDEIDIETWDQVMTINVRGTWLMTRAFAPMLKSSARGGRLVNLASDTALWGAPNLLHYVSSKGAVISMTRSLSRELGPFGITVNAIAPGLVRVEATDYVPEQRKQLYVDGAAIQRSHMPEDTVGAAVFLLSDAAAFVSGQVIPVNGGFICA